MNARTASAGIAPRSLRHGAGGLRAALFVTAWLLGALPTASWAAGTNDDEPGRILQERLEEASRLNVTAPWPESQAILDEIEPLLEHATPDQYATFQHLEIRNLALDGKLQTALERTEALLERDIPEHQRLKALMRGANLAMIVRRFEEAFDYLNRTLELEPRVDHPDLPADAHSLAADIMRSIGEFDAAIEHGHEGVEVAQARGNIRTECIARMRLSAAYKAKDDTQSAIRHYRRAMERCREADEPVYTGIVEFGLGDTFRKTGRLDEARPLLEAALERHIENDYAIGVSETRLSLARLHLQAGDLDRAEDMLQGLIERFTQSERWDDLVKTHETLGSIAEQRGDLEEALHHFNEQKTARERFLDMDRARQLAYLEVAFQTQITEQELALLREQARVSDLEEESYKHQRRLIYMGYIVTAFLVMVLALMLAHATRDRRRYRRLSRFDGLTGLFNHTHFFELADSAFEASRAQVTPFTLVLADIDMFKRVNDEHGHLTGDEVLRRVAARLREVFGDTGIVGRIGGEEFAIALPDQSIADVRKPLEELRDRLRSNRAEDDDIRVSMSFGVAQTRDESSLTELRRRADEALYEAKRSGRDRAVYVNDGA
jgi:diguanylate cyclase (GGDEF)-like protein